MFAKYSAIIFDLDGTLYKMRGGSYDRSPLKRYVQRNAVAYLAARLSISRSDAQAVLQSILAKHGENISLGVEQELGLDRYDYFKTAWNIPARLVVSKERNLRRNLSALKKRYRLVMVSDAPLVWTKNVLAELGVSDLFRSNIFSGEGNQRKGVRTAFPRVLKSLRLKPGRVVSVGDQEGSDIIPAKSLGLLTVFISPTKKSSQADFSVKSIAELTRLLLQ